jgi:tetratricopeptide (TPR) repeat protein
VASLDKYEYKVRADEIKSLISEGEYAEAVKIADSIDWRRVKSVMMLCTISDLYKINRRYEDSKDILLLAYEKHTGGRLIVYSLCELSIKLGELVQALEYYKEFVQLAPKDSGRYVLLYKLYEAQEVSLEERIEVLEELKQRDYREKWAYELAYLYHRVGLASKCIEECDEMFLWFGEGRHVLKALELKMLHEPLNADQQAKYDQMKLTGGFIQSEYMADQQSIMEKAGEETEDEEDDEFSLEENILTDSTKEMPAKEEIDIQVKTVDVSQYNTINLQKELAESMKEFLDQGKSQDMPVENTQPSLDEKVEEPLKTDGSKFEPEINDAESELVEDKNTFLDQEVFFGNTEEVNIQDVVSELMLKSNVISPFAPVNEQVKVQETPLPEASPVSSVSNTGVIKTFTKKSGYDDMLSQEYDGQISLVVPEAEKVEKQITGQLSIEDIMAEWERMKQENERKRMETIRQRVRQQTDTLFADFDESTKSGLLENLEEAMVKAAIKEEKQKTTLERPKVIKVADIENEENQDKDPVPELVESPDEENLVLEDEISEMAEELDTALQEDEEDSVLETAEEDLSENTENTAKEKKAVLPKETSENKEEEKSEHPDGKENEDKYVVREMSNSEREQFAPFIHHKKTRKQIVEAIDNISMASYTGNVIITGEEGTGAIALAKLLVKEIQLSDSNFSGKVAKISGATLNKKEIGVTLSKLTNGALIIETAASMKKATVEKLLKELNQEEKGLIILMEDTKSAMNELLKKNPEMKNAFNLRIDIEALDDQTLVKYAKKYALDQEYSIDELGVLALHTRIADMQTSDHEVTLAEIEELVDEAIYYADRKTPKHFLDILVGKRYDEEDMIVLREKDFMHN